MNEVACIKTRTMLVHDIVTIREQTNSTRKRQKSFAQGYNFDIPIEFHCHFPSIASIVMFRPSLKSYDSQLELGVKIVEIA